MVVTTPLLCLVHKRRLACLLDQRLWLGSCGGVGWVMAHWGGKRGGAARGQGLHSVAVPGCNTGGG
eukprot:6120158-Amphidinium_carterae.1